MRCLGWLRWPDLAVGVTGTGTSSGQVGRPDAQPPSAQAVHAARAEDLLNLEILG